ncbi:MAG: GH36-type glycosyl hydrolase domain-containing protein [Phycisphaeraceae bacterium]
MRYGYFDDQKREYVIDRPDTPRPWSNYLGSTEYGAIITNNAGGYSFYKSAAQGRFLRLRFNSIPMDQPGRYFYLRDQSDGDLWSAAWQPCGKPLDQYASTCRFGTGYTVINSRYRDIATEATYFVPMGALYEVWRFRVTNDGNSPRKISVFPYAEFASSWDTRQDLVNLQYSQYIVHGEATLEDDRGLIECSINRNLPPDPDNFTNGDQCRFSFMALAGARPSGFDTDREKFMGIYDGYARPAAVAAGRCGDTEAEGDNVCGAFQVDLALEPGESKQLVVLVGIGKAKEQGAAAIDRHSDPEVLDAALEEVKQYWHSQLDSVHVETGDPEFDSMVNVWNAYNRLITYRWSRAASLVYNGERDGLGYRDTVQDLLTVFEAIPEEGKERLSLMISGQYSNGGCKSVVQPFAHKPGTHPQPSGPLAYRADDAFWLFNTVPAYVKETGDLDYLEQSIPYADAGEATVLEHLRQAIQFSLDHLGPHGLPYGMEADWNDCIQFGEQGESVFVAFQLRLGLVTYIDLCERLGKQDEIAWAKEKLAQVDKRLDEFVWDGQWYRRGTQKDGSLLGSDACEEGKIFLNAQAWAVISGYATGDRALQAMDAVREHLATDYGVMACAPPFVKANVDTVRAVLMNPGSKENAGIFCHPQGWAVWAEAMLGRGDLAYDYYRAYMPSAYNDRAEIREVEPYVHCQSTHSIYSKRYGASRLPWLSGTASWSFFAATQSILGLKPDYDGLRLDPCLPAKWKSLKMSRRFRGATYEITLTNPRGLARGISQLRVDGETVEGNLIPLAQPGQTVKVEAEITG